MLFHVGGFLILYAVLRLQALLPFNPAGMTAMPEALSFNTAISFITNTNWQNYGGESTLSYLAQMLGLPLQCTARRADLQRALDGGFQPAPDRDVELKIMSFHRDRREAGRCQDMPHPVFLRKGKRSGIVRSHLGKFRHMLVGGLQWHHQPRILPWLAPAREHRTTTALQGCSQVGE